VTSELDYLSLRELACGLRSGDVRAGEAMEAHLDRIAEVNPVLGAVVTVDAEGSMASARAAEARLNIARRRGDTTGLPSLLGVPMTHKDTHDTAGMRTTYGSPIFAENVPRRDALIVARLHAAGVIGTGKSNVPEFACGAHTFNPLFGTTVNPYDPSRSAAGSSGGAAAAIAAGVQAAGDGSDTGGSLRMPASFNNLVGLRPSNGWIPHTLPGNPWEWLSQAGFMARTVGDVAWLMDLVSGPDPRAATDRHEPGRFDLPEYTQPDFQPDLGGRRIGFAPDLGGLLEVDAEVAAVVGTAAEVFAGLGADLDGTVPDLSCAGEVFAVARAFEFGLNYGHLLAEHADQMKPALRGNIRAGLELGPERIFAAVHARGRLWAAVQDYFADHAALVTVTSQVLPFDAELEFPAELAGHPVRDYLSWMDATTLISATGCPAVSVPAGFSASGLPVGLQIIGAPGDDAGVLQIAHAFEVATGYGMRRPGPLPGPSAHRLPGGGPAA
jgi:amidase